MDNTMACCSWKPAKAAGAKPAEAAEMVDIALKLLDSDPRPGWLAEALGGRQVWLDRELSVLCGTLNEKGNVRPECALGVALSLLALTSTTQLNLNLDSPQGLWSEAVKAFFKALASNRATVVELGLAGEVFGTARSAFELGQFLNTNATLQILQVNPPALLRLGGQKLGNANWWNAFSMSLRGNATLRALLVVVNQEDGVLIEVNILAAVVNRFDALTELTVVLPRVRDAQQIRQPFSPLLTNPASTLTSLMFRTYRPELETLEAVILVTAELLAQNPSTKLEVLDVDLWPFNLLSGSRGVATVSACEKVADMLRSNSALKTLSYAGGYEFRGSAVVDAMSENHRLGLEELSLTLDPAAATALFLLLTPPATALPQLRKLAVWKCNGGAEALARMLQLNKTVVKLHLQRASYSREEWVDILPQLKSNTTLETLNLAHCHGVDGEEVYKVLTDLLIENTTIQEIDLSRTPLEVAGKAEAITQAIRRNVEYRAAFADLPTMPAKSGRLVLCGYPEAGKSTLLATMRSLKQQQQASPGETNNSTTPSLPSSSYAGEKKRPRTRGIEVVRLVDDEDLRVAVWDFAGQPEYYALHDCVFPDTNGSSIFLFAYNPIREGTPDDKMMDFRLRLEYWLRFICSNSRPEHPIKPTVIVVVTHQDEVAAKLNHQQVRITVEQSVQIFGNLVQVETGHIFLLNATKDEEVAGVLGFIEIKFKQLLKGLRVPTIAELIVLKLGEWAKNAGGKPIMSRDTFNQIVQEACPARKMGMTFGKASYLRDTGAIIYFENLDFMVIDPHWFGHAIFGYLMNPSSLGEENMPRFKPTNGIIAADEVDEFWESSLRRINASKGIEMSSEMLIQLMKSFNLCYDYIDKKSQKQYLFPILMEGATYSDVHVTQDITHSSVLGERKLQWKNESRTDDVYVGFRLHCADEECTFLTPEFFPRLQIILYDLCVSKGWVATKNLWRTNLLEANMFHVSIDGSGHEILVEYSAQVGYFVDVLVRSKRGYGEVVTFVQTHFIATIRDFCASQQGCIGVSLVQSLLRKECVRSLTLCKYRAENVSLLISELKDKISRLPDNIYICEWQAIQGSVPPLASNSEYATLIQGDIILLDDDKKIVLDAQLGYQIHPTPVEHGPIYLIDNAGVWRMLVSGLYCQRVIPLRLHIHCKCNGNRNHRHSGPTHIVASQRGRRFYLMERVAKSRQPCISRIYSWLCWTASIGAQFAPVPGVALAGSALKDAPPLSRTPYCDKVIEDFLEKGEKVESVSIDKLIPRLEKFFKDNPIHAWTIQFLEDRSIMEKYFHLARVRVRGEPNSPGMWMCYPCLEHDKDEQKYESC